MISNNIVVVFTVSQLATKIFIYLQQNYCLGINMNRLA